MNFTAGFFIRYLLTDLAFFHASLLTPLKAMTIIQMEDEKSTLGNLG